MPPRIVLKVKLYLHTSRRHRKPLSDRPFWRFLQQKIPFLFRRPSWEHEDLHVPVFALIPAPAAEVNAVVTSARRLAAPDGCSYAVDEWAYRSEDNTFVAVMRQCYEHVRGDDATDLATFLENHLETDYLRQGFHRKYPSREVVQYRREPEVA